MMLDKWHTKRRAMALSMILFLLFGVPGCGQESSSITECGADSDSAFGDDPLPPYKAGHKEMEPISYTLSGGKYESGRTRIWYSFHRADEDWEAKPLFVMFNGGPGSSTAILLAWNTSRVTVDEHFTDGELTGVNPYSWTSIGNLLYIDARQTGFSYGLVEDPEIEANREAEFDERNHNFIFDAAEFVRVILRFAKQYPSIRSNEIIMTGESYGGTRATAILNLLLNYVEWGVGDRYYADPALTLEIQEYYDEVFPENVGMVTMPEQIATHFSRQIMIQPFTVGDRQRQAGAEELELPGSPLYDIADETGVPFVPCAEQDEYCDPWENVLEWIDASGRDIYYMSKPYGWLLEYFFGGSAILAQSEVLEAITGVELETMELMFASEREEAFRGTDYVSSGDLALNAAPKFEREFVKQMAENAARVNGDLADIYGELEDYDMYYNSYCYEVSSGFHDTILHPYDETTLGDLMIENMGYVETFITNATYDFRCYTPGVPRALAEFTDKIKSVDINEESFTVYFKPGLFGDDGVTATTVAFPTYEEAGHTVSYCAPQKFLEDVESWIAE